MDIEVFHLHHILYDDSKNTHVLVPFDVLA